VIRAYRRHRPAIHATAWVADSAEVIGRVTIAQDTSIWFNAVLRGDLNRIAIGASTNIQDGCILHVDHDAPCLINERVLVGHQAMLHGCTVEPEALIGMGAIILSHARVGRGAVVGSGSLVPEGMHVPPGKVVVGIPARVVRSVTAQDRRYLRQGIATYVQLAKRYRQAEKLPYPLVRQPDRWYT